MSSISYIVIRALKEKKFNLVFVILLFIYILNCEAKHPKSTNQIELPW